jgi:hypothetical protein
LGRDRGVREEEKRVQERAPRVVSGGFKAGPSPHPRPRPHLSRLPLSHAPFCLTAGFSFLVLSLTHYLIHNHDVKLTTLVPSLTGRLQSESRAIYTCTNKCSK